MIGDLDHVPAAPDALAWVQAVRAFATCTRLRMGRPGDRACHHEEPPSGASTVLSTYADLKVTANHRAHADVAHRWQRGLSGLNWPQDVTTVHMPFDMLPRPPGRKIDN